MSFDFKKEYKEFYLPPKQPVIVNVPEMNFIAVRGKGSPNEEEGEYHKSINILYGIAYTIRMSYKGEYKIDGFFEYVVPPLEGFWWQEGIQGVDYLSKDSFQWISLLRLPDFVKEEDFEWAVNEAARKKKQDFSKAEFLTYAEGLCVQCMHIGSYDDEPSTVTPMDNYAVNHGYAIDISAERFHHEIYISDPRKSEISKRKTVVRHPIKKRA